MESFIDDFLSGLEQDRSKQQDFSDRIQKVFFNYEGNHGVIMFAPFLDSKTHRPYVSLPGVKEYKATCSKYKNGEEETWIKILPKQFYNNLSDEDSALYDRVSALWDQVNDELSDVADSYFEIRTKTYSLFQGILLSHQDLKKKDITDNIGKACLFIYPSKSPVNALATAIESKTAALKSKEWLSVIFTPSPDGREGAVVLSFEKKSDGGFGYSANVSFELNSSFNKIVDSSKFEAAEIEKLKDMITPFLGWMAGEESPFDPVVFKELAKSLEVRLRTHGAPKPKDETAPANKNGVDPMLNPTVQPEASASPAASIEQPSGMPTPAPTVGGINYPF